MKHRYNSTGFVRFSLLLVWTVFLLFMTGGAAHAQTQAAAKIVIHLVPAGGGCAGAPMSLACNGGSSVQSNGSLNTDYDAYVVAVNLDPTRGLREAEFGIFYHFLSEAGLTVSSWTSCADVEAPGPDWPDPGSGIQLAYNSCTGNAPDPGDGSGKGMVVLGVFEVSATSKDHLFITRRFDSGNTPMTITDCFLVSSNLDDGSNAGVAAFGASDGYDPCSVTGDRIAIACCLASGCQNLDPVYCDYLGGQPQFDPVFLIFCGQAECPVLGVPGDATGGRPILGNFSPNPFRGDRPGSIAFRMPAEGPARVVVYDLAGSPVKTVFDGTAVAGWNDAAWDGTDAEGRPAPSGIYHYRLLAGGVSVETRKVVLLRD